MSPYEWTIDLLCAKAENLRPVTPLVHLQIAEDSSLTYILPGLDPERDHVTFSFGADTRVEGLLQLINPSTGLFSFQPDSDWSGDVFVQYFANDGNQVSLPGILRITVDPVADAPFLAVAQAQVRSCICLCILAHTDRRMHASTCHV